MVNKNLPWSILVPLKFFFLFAGIPPSDLIQAGLLVPLSITIGLICIMSYNGNITAAPANEILGDDKGQGDYQV